MVRMFLVLLISSILASGVYAEENQAFKEKLEKIQSVVEIDLHYLNYDKQIVAVDHLYDFIFSPNHRSYFGAGELIERIIPIDPITLSDSEQDGLVAVRSWVTRDFAVVVEKRAILYPFRGEADARLSARLADEKKIITDIQNLEMTLKASLENFSVFRRTITVWEVTSPNFSYLSVLKTLNDLVQNSKYSNELRSCARFQLIDDPAKLGTSEYSKNVDPISNRCVISLSAGRDGFYGQELYFNKEMLELFAKLMFEKQIDMLSTFYLKESNVMAATLELDSFLTSAMLERLHRSGVIGFEFFTASNSVPFNNGVLRVQPNKKEMQKIVDQVFP